MKEIKFNKQTKGNEIIIDVELPRRHWAKDPIINFSNSEMNTYLESEGIKLEEYEVTSSPSSLSSYSDKKNEPNLEGTWIFKKKQQKKTNKSKLQTSNKSKDTQNTGD